MNISDNKITAFTKTHVGQSARPALTVLEIQQLLDSSPEELRVALNNLIDGLLSTIDGNSGGDNIYLTAIADLTGNTVQSFLEELVSKLKSIVDANSGADYIGATSISGLAGETVQALLESLKTFIDTHKASSDHDGRYYTEAETDTLFATKGELDGLVLGQIPDDTLTEAKMTDEMKISLHVSNEMPHTFIDGGAMYRWGFRTVDGVPQFIYEEVI